MPWLGSLVVGSLAAIAYGCAVGGADALASDVHRGVVVVAFLATLLGWGFRRRVEPLLVFIAVKGLALAAALPPTGWISLTASYRRLRLQPGWLDYFWVTPLVLLALTVLESWVLSAVDRDEPFRSTTPYRRRHQIALALGVLALGTGLWRFGGPRFRVWHMKDGGGDREMALRDMGHRALPAVYASIVEIGDQAVGDYRVRLVGVVTGIRRDDVARMIDDDRHGAGLVATVDVDETMRDHLVFALTHEPMKERRFRLAGHLRDVDHRMAAAVYCEAVPRLPPSAALDLLPAVEQHVLIASGIGEPVRGRPNPREALAKMRDELRRCVPAVTLTAITACPDCDDRVRQDASRILSALAPFDPAPQAALVKLVAASSTDFEASARMGELRSVIQDPAAFALDVLRAPTASRVTRRGVLMWLASDGDAATVERVACEALAELDDAERMRLLESKVLATPRSDEPACVSEQLRQLVDDAGESPTIDFALLERLLLVRVAQRPELRSWAATSLEQDPGLRKRRLLRRLAE